MNKLLVVAHDLILDETDTLRNRVDEGQPFDVTTYSRMKFGDAIATQTLADQLTPKLIAEAPSLVEAQTPPLFAVAYKAVPPACFYISQNCLAGVNEVRVTRGLEPGRIAHVFKDSVTATNYASASHEQRQAELNSIGFTFEGRDISESSVVVLDDVRITGSAEQRIADLIEKERAPELVLGYIALLDPTMAVERPSIEHDMNSAYVTDIHDVKRIIDDGHFVLNIRTLKLILGSQTETLTEVLSNLNTDLLEQLYRGAIATGPAFIEQYGNGFTVLKQHVTERRELA